MIKIEAEGLQLATLTDVGRKRSGNEDSHAVWVSEEPAEFARRGALLVVADGMGGANAGEWRAGWPPTRWSRPTAPTRAAIPRTRCRSRSRPPTRASTRSPSPTTTSAAWAPRAPRSSCAATGLDRSRGRFARLPRARRRGAPAHERPLAGRRAGRTRPPDRAGSAARSAPQRGHAQRRRARRRAGGRGPDRRAAAPGDRIVLCSDGLHGQVSDSEIAMLAGDRNPTRPAESLIDLANERGGPDNITVIVARVPGVSGDRRAPRRRSRGDDHARARARGACDFGAGAAGGFEEQQRQAVGGSPMLPN